MTFPTYAGRLPAPITALVLGSRSIPGQAPPFACLPEQVPGSRIIAVDVEPEKDYPDGWEFCPAIIGTKSDARPFYHGNQAMVSSLYKLNWRYMNAYRALGPLTISRVEEVAVIGLDEFAEGKRPIHFIHADIQGAELEAFESGPQTLADTLLILVEVAFAPVYQGAPLWRDIDASLAAQGFEFHRLAGAAAFPEEGLSAKHTADDGRWMWGDALYVRKNRQELDDESLLRLSALAHAYRQYPLAAACLARVAGVGAAREYIAAVYENREKGTKNE